MLTTLNYRALHTWAKEQRANYTIPQNAGVVSATDAPFNFCHEERRAQKINNIGSVGVFITRFLNFWQEERVFANNRTYIDR
jgi:hypothetical protein